jgi:hypothetical protein
MELIQVMEQARVYYPTPTVVRTVLRTVAGAAIAGTDEIRVGRSLSSACVVPYQQVPYVLAHSMVHTVRVDRYCYWATIYHWRLYHYSLLLRTYVISNLLP